MKNLSLVASLLLAAPLAAQTQIWQDDFNDGIVDPNWTVTFSPLQFWQVGEAGGYFQFNGLTAPFGAFNETYELEQPVPSVSGALTLEIGLEWADSQFVPAGGSVLDTKVDRNPPKKHGNIPL